jgi:type IV pilus assembly protein PilE
MKKMKGFTLIELMIVVAIVGILASISMAYYGGYVIASNRTEGRSALAQVAGSLEKCRSLYGSYDNVSCNVALPMATDSNFYNISASAIAGTSFTLTATPVAGSAQSKDTDCTTITLTNTGIKSGTGADAIECW